MPWMDEAQHYNPMTKDGGSYASGPAKGVWHKTQGSTAAGAFGAYRANGSAPHFTVDGPAGHDGQITQHIDTDYSSYALYNYPGWGVETNRDSAIQIEVVGFVNTDMSEAQKVSCLFIANWLEIHHGIPKTWPTGRPPYPYPDSYGEHNGYRHPEIWDTHGGHYGHSQVPENDHGDPAWTDWEWTFMSFEHSVPQPPKTKPHKRTVTLRMQEIY